MRRDDQRQAVKNIPLEQLKPFKNHPFQVRDDEEFRRLVEKSVRPSVLDSLKRPLPPPHPDKKPKQQGQER